MNDKLFASMVLPVKPAFAATGATITVIEEPIEAATEETAESFFGGYAESGMLHDLGFESVAEAPIAEELKA